MKNNTEKKLLYKYIGYLNIDEYKKEILNFKSETYWKLVLKYSIFNLIIGAIVSILFRSYFVTAIVLIIIQLIIMFYVRLRYINILEKNFLSVNANVKDESYIIEFYDEYLIRKFNDNSIKISYKDIDKIVETDENIYLKINSLNLTLIIIKEKCNEKISNFINENINELVKSKNATRINKSDSINLKLSLFLILTVAAYFISDFVHNIVNYSVNDKISFLTNSWVYLLFIPFPILSLLVGNKYKKKGFNCTLNIILGYIILFILVIKFLPTLVYNSFFDDYNNLYSYEDILNIELPNKGKLQIINNGNISSKKDYKFIRAYYGKDIKLNDTIKNSNTWISLENVDKDLKNNISNYVTLEKPTYLSIYNRTTNEYNSFSQESRENEYIIMEYSKEMNTINIHHFKID